MRTCWIAGVVLVALAGRAGGMSSPHCNGQRFEYAVHETSAVVLARVVASGDGVALQVRRAVGRPPTAAELSAAGLMIVDDFGACRPVRAGDTVLIGGGQPFLVADPAVGDSYLEAAQALIAFARTRREDERSALRWYFLWSGNSVLEGTTTARFGGSLWVPAARAEELWPLALHLVEAGDGRRATRAVRALAHLGRVQALPTLNRLLGHRRPEVRFAAWDALREHHGWPGWGIDAETFPRPVWSQRWPCRVDPVLWARSSDRAVRGRFSPGDPDAGIFVIERTVFGHPPAEDRLWFRNERPHRRNAGDALLFLRNGGRSLEGLCVGPAAEVDAVEQAVGRVQAFEAATSAAARRSLLLSMLVSAEPLVRLAALELIVLEFHGPGLTTPALTAAVEALLAAAGPTELVAAHEALARFEVPEMGPQPPVGVVRLLRLGRDAVVALARGAVGG